MIRLFLLAVISTFSSVNCFKIHNIESDDSRINISGENSCNNTNFYFFNMEEFSKNIYMPHALQNCTREFPSIEGVSFKPYENEVWAIRNFPKVTFEYNDQNQTASFGQNEIILIEGGKVELVLDFQWVSLKKNTEQDITAREGNAKARAISKEMPFSITVVRNQKSPTGFDLLSWSNITLLHFNIANIDCHLNYQSTNCTVTQEDIFWLNYLLFKANDNLTETIKSKIQKQFNKQFPYSLRKEVRYGDTFTNPSFTYSWKGLTRPSTDSGMSLTYLKDNFNLRFEKNGTKSGVYTSFLTRYTDGTQICGPAVPTSPLNFSIYGKGQQFVSLSVFENLLFKGIQSNQLDTILDRNFWATKNFKFYIDDLAAIMPDLMKSFSNSTDVNGLCRPDDKYYKVGKGTSNQTIKVATNWLCHLNATLNDSNRTKIKLIEFEVNLTSQVYLKFVVDRFDVWLKSYSFNTTYNDSFGFRLENKTLADQKIKDSLERVYQSKLFGSGWPINYGQRIPALYATENYILIYDKFKLN